MSSGTVDRRARDRRPPGSYLGRLRRFAARHALRYRTWRRCGHAYAAPIRPFERHRLAPGAIAYALPPDRRERLEVDDRRIPAVVDGDWDLEADRFVETPLYRSLRERFLEGRPWEETAYASVFDRHPRLPGDPVDVLRAGTRRERLRERYAALDALYEEVKSEGYPPASDRDRSGGGPPPEATGAVLVDVGRDGRFVLHAGGHRLAIARLLDVEAVPATVFVRHERWQARRDRLVLTGAGDGDHPDLRGLAPERRGERR